MGRYKNAFKACTALLKPSMEDEEVTKGTVSIQNAVDCNISFSNLDLVNLVNGWRPRVS